MLCQNCQKNAAKIHVSELRVPADGRFHPPEDWEERHLCDTCAQSVELPSVTPKKDKQEIWKLLQIAAQQTRKKSGPACPDCGMTLDEFRKKGRLGCPRDYSVFKQHIGEIVERVHGARRHVGRVPGNQQAQSQPAQPLVETTPRLVELRRELEEAKGKEDYERAARLRDAIRALESSERA